MTHEPSAALDWYKTNIQGSKAATIDFSDKDNVVILFESPKGIFEAKLADVCGNKRAIERAFGHETYPRELFTALARHNEISNAIIMGAQESGGVTHARKFHCVIH